MSEETETETQEDVIQHPAQVRVQEENAALVQELGSLGAALSPTDVVMLHVMAILDVLAPTGTPLREMIDFSKETRANEILREAVAQRRRDVLTQGVVPPQIPPVG